MTEEYLQRFVGIKNLYGLTGLEKLHNSHICVVGIGGVGSWAVEALARAGVGELTLIDMDDICVTNINRQIHALSGNIGSLKTEIMQQRIKLINPDCKVNLIDDFLSLENIAEYITKDHSYIIDAIDNATVKAGLIAFCKSNKIKIITTGAAGGKLDPTQIKILDLTKTTHDPLSSKVRSLLRSKYNFSSNLKRKFGVDCVFSTEQLNLVKTEAKEVCNAVQANNCNSGLGTITMETGTFGFFAASRVINKILAK